VGEGLVNLLASAASLGTPGTGINCPEPAGDYVRRL